MTDIRIRWHNHLHCRIESNAGVGFELAEEFSFFVEGYKFMPLFKAGRWDGKIKLFNLKTRLFFIGLIPNLIEFAKDNGYTIEIVDKDQFKPVFELHPDWTWKRWTHLTPHAHQIEAFEKAIKYNKTLILSPTGSGKSLLIYLIVRYLLEECHDDILITVPTTGLVEQLHSDFKSYVADGWDVDENVAKIYSGKDKAPKARCVVSTWQSIFRLPATWFGRFGAFICDEAHGADAKSLSAIVENLSHCPFRLGVTGTLDGTVMHELEMKGRFGPIFRVATSKDLMDKGLLSPIEVHCLELMYSKEEIKLIRKADYAQEVAFLVQHEKRNNLLCNAALRTTGNTLMLFQLIEKHGEKLYKILKEKAEEHGKQIHYIKGATHVDDREAIRTIAENVDNAIILASYGTSSTGMNIKNLHNLILCHPFKAQIKNLQSIGRVLRAADDKEKATLIDIGDNLVHKSSKGKESPNTTFKHFIHRLKMYQNQGFRYRIAKIPLTTGP